MVCEICYLIGRTQITHLLQGQDPLHHQKNKTNPPEPPKAVPETQLHDDDNKSQVRSKLKCKEPFFVKLLVVLQRNSAVPAYCIHVSRGFKPSRARAHLCLCEPFSMLLFFCCFKHTREIFASCWVAATIFMKKSHQR